MGTIKIRVDQLKVKDASWSPALKNIDLRKTHLKFQVLKF